jgi:hypothetical protein
VITVSIETIRIVNSLPKLVIWVRLALFMPQIK